MDKVVAIWNQSHPDIQVQVQVQAGGDAELTKLLTAAKAGNPPDLAQVEYQVLPTLVSSNYLANIASYDSGLKSDFPAGIWNQVTLGTSALYGVPQDAAPMALFYRADAVQEVPPDRADHLGAVRRRRRQAAQRGAGGVPGHVLQRRPGRVRRADPAGGGAVVVRLRQHLDGEHRRRRQPEGRLVLAVAGVRGRGRQPAAVDGRLEQGDERREVHRLGLRRLGPRRHADRRRRRTRASGT